jgi:hypothetical protein
LEARIRIRLRDPHQSEKSDLDQIKIRIRMYQIIIRIRIRIHVKVISRIRIRIKVMMHTGSRQLELYAIRILNSESLFLRKLLLKSAVSNLYESGAGIFKQSIGARNRVVIGLSYRLARQHRLAELIPWNRFLGSLKVKKFRLRIRKPMEKDLPPVAERSLALS